MEKTKENSEIVSEIELTEDTTSMREAALVHEPEDVSDIACQL